MQSSAQKPKILFNYSVFTQRSDQKFTLQNINSYITDALSFANTKLLSQKTQQFSVLSKKIMSTEADFLQNGLQNVERYAEEIGQGIKEYEQNLQNVPTFITEKLREYADSKSMEFLGRRSDINLKQEMIEEQPTKIEVEKSGTKVNKKEVKKEETGNEKLLEDSDEEDYGLARGISKIKIENTVAPKNSKAMYNHQNYSDEDDEEWESYKKGDEDWRNKKVDDDWMKDDLGSLFQNSNIPPIHRSGGQLKGNKNFLMVEAPDADNVSIQSGASDQKSKGGRRKRDAIQNTQKSNQNTLARKDQDISDEEEGVNPLLKKTKKTTNSTQQKKQTQKIPEKGSQRVKKGKSPDVKNKKTLDNYFF